MNFFLVPIINFCISLIWNFIILICFNTCHLLQSDSRQAGPINWFKDWIVKLLVDFKCIKRPFQVGLVPFYNFSCVPKMMNFKISFLLQKLVIWWKTQMELRLVDFTQVLVELNWRIFVKLLLTWGSRTCKC